MTKYIIAVDYKAEYKPLTIEYYDSTATELDEAMIEAQKYYTENTWAVSVFKKVGATQKKVGYPGWTRTRYTESVKLMKNWFPVQHSDSDRWDIYRETHKGCAPVYELIAPWEK